MQIWRSIIHVQSDQRRIEFDSLQIPLNTWTFEEEAIHTAAQCTLARRSKFGFLSLIYKCNLYGKSKWKSTWEREKEEKKTENSAGQTPKTYPCVNTCSVRQHIHVLLEMASLPSLSHISNHFMNKSILIRAQDICRYACAIRCMRIVDMYQRSHQNPKSSLN